MDMEKINIVSIYTSKGYEDVALSGVIDLEQDTRETKEGNRIISYAWCKKLARNFSVCKKDVSLVCTPTQDNKQQHIYTMWLGFKGDNDRDNWVHVEGEASKYNTGKYSNSWGSTKYVEHNQIDAMYRSAIAYKRAFCKGVIQLLELHEFKADVEAKDFEKEITTMSAVEESVDYSKL